MCIITDIDNTIVASFIGVGGTILGVLIGGMLSKKAALESVEASNKNAIAILRMEERARNVAALRAAFAPSLSFIYGAKNHRSTNNIPNVDATLKGSLADQATNIEFFRPFVAEKDRSEYQKAWEKYHYEVRNYGFNANANNPKLDEYSVYEKMIGCILKFTEID